MNPLDHINPSLPTPKTRDGVLDAFIEAIRERMRELKVNATSETFEHLPFLGHALAELLLVQRYSKQEVKMRLAELKTIPDNDFQVELRDTSLAILKKVGKALNS